MPKDAKGHGRDFGVSNKQASFNATVSPTTRDLEWAAGFMEGEGSFQYSRTQNVSANQVNPEPLERLLSWFSGRVILLKEKKSSTRSDIWRWQVSGARARGVMMTLYPLVSTKRQGQIEAALAGHKYT